MKHAQRQPAKREAEEEEAVPETSGADETELTEDVSCCLAEIDEVLAEQEDERAKAEREFQEVKARYDSVFYADWPEWADEADELDWLAEHMPELRKAEKEAEDELRIWQAKYAHLGLHYHWCCGALEIRHTQ